MQASLCNAPTRHHVPGCQQQHRQAAHRPVATLHGGSSPCSCSPAQAAAFWHCRLANDRPSRPQLLTAAAVSDDAAATSTTTSSNDSGMAATCSTSMAADASSIMDSTTTSSSGSESGSNASGRIAGYQQHDVLCCTCEGAPAPVYLEVVSSPAAPAAAPAAATAPTGTMICSRQGVTYTVTHDAVHGGLTATPTGWHLTPDSQLVTTFPGWAQQLQQLRQRLPLPTQPLHLQVPAVAGCPATLQQAVAAQPRLWRDGTGPGDAPLKGVDQQLLCAGELECLLQRQRGVVMVQLCAGWDTSGAPQPVDNPLVVHQMQRVLARSDLSIFMSEAPGGLGLTAIITAKAEPFRSWGAHLASFGAQAALVAESPFYKLLIGRVLGYKEEHVLHHIRSVHGLGAPSQVVREAVTKELHGLSQQPPTLPWVAPPQGSSRGGNSGRGKSGKQQPAKGSRRRR